MNLFVLSGRCGVHLEPPIISTDVEKLRSTMRKWYKDTLAEYNSCKWVDMESSFCKDNSACVAVGSDWEEVQITAHSIAPLMN